MAASSAPISSCMYSTASIWSQKDLPNNHYQWFLREDDLYQSQVTAPLLADADGSTKEDCEDDDDGYEDESASVSKPSGEKNSKKNLPYKHVPHKEKPPQVVAKRNARERRRVQAVNTAFTRLRKAVPFENARGKRISKVKTLQNAIEYINRLQELLKYDGDYSSFHLVNYKYGHLNECSQEGSMFREF